MVYDYNEQIVGYHDDRVNIGEPIREKLRKNRDANEDRIIRDMRPGISVSKSSFVKQGSYAMRTMIQDANNDYDIDDGLLLNKDELVHGNGAEMTPLEVRDIVFDAVSKNNTCKKDPERLPNCIRVHYVEGHHVDIPALRVFQDGSGTIQLAGTEWEDSNPKEINDWFSDKFSGYEKQKEGRGRQMRRMVRYLKRFGRSRPSWNMPSGLILTMLVVEALEKIYAYDRDDERLYYLIKQLNVRLGESLRVENLSDKSSPREVLTKSDEDASMELLRDKLVEAQDNLAVLESAICKRPDARKAWDWFFRSGGFFEDYDAEHGSDDEGGSGLAPAEPKSPVDPRGSRRFG